MKIITNQVPSVEMGGVVLPVSEAIILTCACSSTRHDSFKRLGAAYLVPTGYKLQVLAFRITAVLAAAGALTMASADATVSDNASPPSGYAAILSGGAVNSPGYTKAEIGAVAEEPCFYEIAAAKYPTAYAPGTTCLFSILCRLVKV